jgi:pentatricopeptide repeat protein
MLCLRLGRAGDLEGIQRLIALVPRPSAMCYEAVVSCLAFRGDFVGATRVAEHVVAAGLAPSYLFFRDLLNCLEGRS